MFLFITLYWSASVNLVKYSPEEIVDLVIDLNDILSSPGSTFLLPEGVFFLVDKCIRKAMFLAHRLGLLDD